MHEICCHLLTIMLISYLPSQATSAYISFDWMPVERYDFSASSINISRLLFTEGSSIFFSLGNSILVTNPDESTPPRVLATWFTTDSHLIITSCLRLVHPSTGLKNKNIYLVCASTALNGSDPLEDSRLLFDGMLCSFWFRPHDTSEQWIRMPSGSQLWSAAFTTSLESGAIFASRLMLSPASITNIDSLGRGAVAGYTGKHLYNDYQGQWLKPWISRFSVSPHKPNLVNDPVVVPPKVTSSGWLSNSDSDLWFNGPVKFHNIFATGGKYFYIVFTEEDITRRSSSSDYVYPAPKRSVTRVARVCSNDPGQGEAGAYLTTSGVFSTFRKTRLMCRLSSKTAWHQPFPHEEANHSPSSINRGEQNGGGGTDELLDDRSKYLEFTRALAVSDVIATTDAKDHVFYALMATDESVSGIMAICAFNLRAVNIAIDAEQLVTWHSPGITLRRLFHHLWRKKAIQFDLLGAEDELYSIPINGPFLGLVRPNLMTEAISKASKTCPSSVLPEYYGRFATLHPLVASTVLAIVPASPGQTSENGSEKVNPQHTNERPKPMDDSHMMLGQAIGSFTLPPVGRHSEREQPTCMTVDWSTNDVSDIMYVGTDKGSVLTINTGLNLRLKSFDSFYVSRTTKLIGSHFVQDRKFANPGGPMGCLGEVQFQPPVFLRRYNISGSSPVQNIFGTLVNPDESSSNSSKLKTTGRKFQLTVITKYELITFTPEPFDCEHSSSYNNQIQDHQYPVGCAGKSRRKNAVLAQTGHSLGIAGRKQITDLALLILIGSVILSLPLMVFLGYVIGKRSRRTVEQYRKVSSTENLFDHTPNHYCLSESVSRSVNVDNLPKILLAPNSPEHGFATVPVNENNDLRINSVRDKSFGLRTPIELMQDPRHQTPMIRGTLQYRIAEGEFVPHTAKCPLSNTRTTQPTCPAQQPDQILTCYSMAVPVSNIFIEESSEGFV
ncbi:unnamed protein product [Calicophoron daubneyi]|uniref:Sema domain-containing protein n=1 Tax=Calicophoron daubneyi TaxID=300641 RepID=A0AAV2TQ25_CALDB